MSSNYYKPDDPNLVFIQSRAEIDLDVVEEYARMMRDGVQFHAAQAVAEEKTIYVYDGYHRGEAARQTGQLLLVAVRPGSREEARWLALAANQDHGLRRSNADKRKIVELALTHPFGTKLSDRQISNHCGVSHTMVSGLRGDLEATGKLLQSNERTGTDGRTINTANIGSNPPAPATVNRLQSEAPRDKTPDPTPDEPEWLEEAGSNTPLTDAVMSLPEEEKDVVINDPDTYAAMGQEQVAAGLAEADDDPESPEAPAPAPAAAPPPPPPPPAPRPAAPPDWHLHITFKSTGVCLATLTQAGQTAPAANLSTHKSTVLAQIGEALEKHVPYYTNGKASDQ